MNVQSNNVRYVRDTRVVEISLSLVPTTNDIVVFISSLDSCVFICLEFLAVNGTCGTGTSAVRSCRFLLVRDEIPVVCICNLTYLHMFAM